MSDLHAGRESMARAELLVREALSAQASLGAASRILAAYRMLPSENERAALVAVLASRLEIASLMRQGG